jgi:hypothetical protein
VFENTKMNWVSGTKKPTTTNRRGDVFEYCF